VIRRRILWPAEARDQFDRIAKAEPSAAGEILSAVFELGDDAHPEGSEPLGASGTYWRLRIGRYRVTYALAEEEIRIVLVSLYTAPELD
jgi:mRNA-degrading endonuclease RelE of RelBE toxin-antitoxin system